MVLRNWLSTRADLTSSKRKLAQRRKQAARGRFEGLESRNLLANYTWSDAGNTLAIDLGTNESVTVSRTGSAISFKLSAGAFSQNGGDTASGNGTATIGINSADVASSVIVRNTGAAAGTNNVTFSGTGSLSAANVEVSITDPDAVGKISFTGGFDIDVTSALSLSTVRNIEVASGTSLTASGSGSISLLANQQTTAASGYFQGISLYQCEISTSGTGDIVLKGRGGNSSNSNFGIWLSNDVVVESTATGPDAGSIILEGTGGAGGDSDAYGVNIFEAEIRSVDGAIQVTGQGGSGGYSDFGIEIDEGTIRSTGVGDDAATINITGRGGAGSASIGFQFRGGLITSVDGDIAIIGVGGQGTAGGNDGVLIEDQALVSSTGTGSNAAKIKIDGTGGGTSDIAFPYPANAGIHMGTDHPIVPNINISSIDGDIELIGERGVVRESYAIEIGHDIEIRATGLANITFTGDTIELTNCKIATLGVLTVRPKTLGRYVRLGGQDDSNQLGLTDQELACITASKIVTGIGFVPAGIVALGAEAGGRPRVKVVDSSGAFITTFLAYQSTFRGGVRIATADLDGDGQVEIITAPGSGRSSLIKVFNLNGHELTRYRTTAYAGFRGGVFVAAGDVNGDGRPDIIVSPDAGMSATIKVFRNRVGLASSNADPITDLAYRSFLAFGKSYTAGARVAAGDLTGDGRAEIVVGNGLGMGPRVRTFDLSQFSTQGLAPNILEIHPFDSAERGGVFVAVRSGANAGDSGIVVGSGVAGGGKIEVYSSSGNLSHAFAAFENAADKSAPVHVAAKNLDIDSTDEILAGQALEGSTSRLRFYDVDGSVLDDDLRNDLDFRTGFFVA